MIVVLDTNVIVSGFLSPSNAPGQILNAITEGRVFFAQSSHLREELERALQYERVKKYLLRCWKEKEILLAAESLASLAISVEDKSPSAQWVNHDADDDWVIQCAISAHASHIITGDRRLLAIENVSEITILSPAAFLREINH